MELLAWRFAEERDAAEGWFDEPREHTQQGRFARAIFAEHHHARTGRQCERDVAQCGESPIDT